MAGMVVPSLVQHHCPQTQSSGSILTFGVVHPKEGIRGMEKLWSSGR